MKDLQLPLIGKWFEMTKAGIKKEDYRKLTLYWFKRLILDKEKTLLYFFPFQEPTDHDIELLCKNNFWRTTLNFKQFTSNIMALGYPKKGDPDRIIKLEHKGISIGEGNTKWGAEPGKIYFIIKHGKII